MNTLRYPAGELLAALENPGSRPYLGVETAGTTGGDP